MKMISTPILLAIFVLSHRTFCKEPNRPPPQIRWSTVGKFNRDLSTHYPRGSELGGVFHELVQAVSDLVAPFGGKRMTLYDEQTHPGLREMTRETVLRIGNLCAAVTSIISEDTAPGSADRLRRLGVENMDRFMKFDSFRALNNMVLNIASDFISSTHYMELPTLIIQATGMIDRYVFMSELPERNKGGWHLDIQKFGVDVSSILPDFNLQPSRPGLSRHEWTQLLDSRLDAFKSGYEFNWSLFPQTSGNSLRDWLFEELDRSVSRTQPKTLEDVLVDEALQNVVFPKIHLLLSYLWSWPCPYPRMRAKLLADLFEFAKSALPIHLRRSLWHGSGYALSLEDSNGPFLDVRQVPHLCLELAEDSSPAEIVRASGVGLDGLMHRFAFAYRGFSVRYNTGSIGDGVRRDWLRRMVDGLFAVYDGTPDGFDLSVYWEYSDERKLTIRPRQVRSMKSDWHKNQLQAGLILCGYILGIAITYDIVPGVALSPVSLALLQQPRSDFASLAREEDPKLLAFLEKLRSLDWSSPDTVAAVLPDEQVRIAGVNMAVDQSNLEIYIRQQQYQKLVDLIYSEMGLVAHGIHTFVRGGFLDQITRDDLMQMLAGSTEVSAAEILSTMDVSGVPGRMAQWITEIVGEMTDEELKLFLVFVTGSKHLPYNHRGFVMRMEVFGENLSMVRPEASYPLPTSRTCFGMLQVPLYPSKESFKRKLMKAITDTKSMVNE